MQISTWFSLYLKLILGHADLIINWLEMVQLQFKAYTTEFKLTDKNQ